MARDLTVREAFANSENEILGYALDEDPEDHPASYPNYISERDDDDYDPSAIEGWDGRELSEAEQWETTLNGPLDSGFDRPLELARDEYHETEVNELRQQLARKDQHIAQLAERADPGRRARAAQAYERDILEIVSSPEQTLTLINQLTARIQKLETSRVNASMHARHAQYGREFEHAYRNLTSMDRNHPAARALVQSVWDDDDPGDALMEFHQKTGGQPVPRLTGGQARRLPPSLSSGERSSAYRSRRAPERSSSSPSRWPVGADAEAADGNAAEDREIMEYALG